MSQVEQLDASSEKIDKEAMLSELVGRAARRRSLLLPPAS